MSILSLSEEEHEYLSLSEEEHEHFVAIREGT